MRILSLIILIFFTMTALAQDVPFSREELKKFRKFEGVQVDFRYDNLVGNYVYKTQLLAQLATSIKVNLYAFIKLVKNDDDYCFSDVHVAFNLYSQGRAHQYNWVEVLIGFPTNIKKGDAIKYEFEVRPDEEGNSTISGEKINEILNKSVELKRPITFNFYNDDDQVSSMMIAYSKVSQKLGGIINTQANLMKKYIRCSF